VLSELEKAIGRRISDQFDLIFGTSTGAIIAAMVGLGWSVDEIKKRYMQLVPQIMGARGQNGKSRLLHKLGKDIFGEQRFDAFGTGIGIVAMNYDTQQPLVFKNTADRAHGSRASFVRGFGVTILDAIGASCAACPIFSKKVVHTVNKGDITAIDGGFIANNPSLFALIDATKALKVPVEQIRLLSIGVGDYVEKPITTGIMGLFTRLEMAQIASKVLVASSNTIEVVTRLLFPTLQMARINDAFPEPQHGTNMIERNPAKLAKMFQLGIGSFAQHEQQIMAITSGEVVNTDGSEAAS